MVKQLHPNVLSWLCSWVKRKVIRAISNRFLPPLRTARRAWAPMSAQPVCSAKYWRAGDVSGQRVRAFRWLGAGDLQRWRRGQPLLRYVRPQPTAVERQADGRGHCRAMEPGAEGEPERCTIFEVRFRNRELNFLIDPLSKKLRSASLS